MDLRKCFHSIHNEKQKATQKFKPEGAGGVGWEARGMGGGRLAGGSQAVWD